MSIGLDLFDLQDLAGAYQCTCQIDDSLWFKFYERSYRDIGLGAIADFLETAVNIDRQLMLPLEAQQ